MGYSVFAMNVEANKVCGRALSYMRIESGMTQVELARRLDVPKSFVSKVETGERALKVYEQFDYARALGIGIADFVMRLQTELDGLGIVALSKPVGK